jgi:hypothetical protein
VPAVALRPRLRLLILGSALLGLFSLYHSHRRCSLCLSSRCIEDRILPREAIKLSAPAATCRDSYLVLRCHQTAGTRGSGVRSWEPETRRSLLTTWGSGARTCTFCCFHTEGFYYVAHRVQKILTNKGGILLGVVGFKGSQSITRIWNHLIEHPFGTYGMTGLKSGLHSHEGPIIAPTDLYIRDYYVFVRPVLVNAKEFDTAVGEVLTTAVAHLAT